jgi:hypothetical protein
MVNVDGVIHGNNRCSLSGFDLNRRWKQKNKVKKITFTTQGIISRDRQYKKRHQKVFYRKRTELRD